MPLIILSTLKTDENNTFKIPFNAICANSLKGIFVCKYAIANTQKFRKSFKNYHFSEKSDDVENIYPWYNHVVK